MGATPHTSESLRQVSGRGVRARIGCRGRCRATSRAAEPGTHEVRSVGGSALLAVERALILARVVGGAGAVKGLVDRLVVDGGGSLRWLDLDVTRWHADTTCDVAGPASDLISTYQKGVGVTASMLDCHVGTGPQGAPDVTVRVQVSMTPALPVSPFGTITVTDVTTRDCGDAHAPWREPSGRDAKYASDSASETFSTAPSMRTTRSSSTQWNCNAAKGWSASSRAFLLW